MTSRNKTVGWIALAAAVVLLSCCAGSVGGTPALSSAGAPAAATAAPTATPAQTPTPPVTSTPAATVTPTPTPTSPAVTVLAEDGSCDPPPLVVPTPADDPGYTRLDPSTGLHMTGKAQLIDLQAYRLRVTGLVERPLELTYDEIRCLPKVEAAPELVCPGFFVDEARWAGAPIADVLALAGVQAGAERVEFISGDGYRTSLSIAETGDRSNFLAYEWEGEPLPRLHGFPLRVVIPKAQGNQWTKWVTEIRVY